MNLSLEYDFSVFEIAEGKSGKLFHKIPFAELLPPDYDDVIAWCKDMYKKVYYSPLFNQVMEEDRVNLFEDAVNLIDGDYWLRPIE